VTILSQQGLFAQTKQSVSWGSSFGDNFRVGSDSVFSDDFRVKRDCVRGRIQAIAKEAVWLMVFESAATRFSLAISESTGTLCADESTQQLWKQCH